MTIGKDLSSFLPAGCMFGCRLQQASTRLPPPYQPSLPRTSSTTQDAADCLIQLPPKELKGLGNQLKGWLNERQTRSRWGWSNGRGGSFPIGYPQSARLLHTAPHQKATMRRPFAAGRASENYSHFRALCCNGILPGNGGNITSPRSQGGPPSSPLLFVVGVFLFL